MPWQSSFNPQLRHVEMKISGVVTRDELAAACDSAVSLVLKHGVLCVLTDCTGLEGGYTITDLYFLSERLAAKEQARQIREAVLLSLRPEIRGTIRFWETACINRGLKVRAFEHREEALSWLHESAQPITHVAS